MRGRRHEPRVFFPWERRRGLRSLFMRARGAPGAPRRVRRRGPLGPPGTSSARPPRCRATRAEITNTIERDRRLARRPRPHLPRLAGRSGVRRLPARAAARRVGATPAGELPGPQGPPRFRRIERRSGRRAARARPCGVTTTRRDFDEGDADANRSNCQRQATARQRASSRGLTLVELVIVITIIGVLTAAISIGVLKAQKSANIGAAKTACSTIRNATMQWKAVNPSADCADGRAAQGREGPRHGLQPEGPVGQPLQGLVRRRRDHLHERRPRPERGDGGRHPRARRATRRKASDREWAPGRGPARRASARGHAVAAGAG